MYSGLRLFKTAFVNTKRQILVSGIFLVVVTCVLNVILYFAESRVDPDFGFWDAFIWPYEKYLGDPGGLFLFAGDRQEFPLISLAEETTIDDNEEPEDESIDELDFSMF